tara:strand:- start:1721 stop:4957 length:3237 start_codon:yes stop_codon:yes gene_type:complete
MKIRPSEPPDLKVIDDGLKDFQRKTVRKVFNTLYQKKYGSRRFLVADEVGLGKTMVARGVIAKAIHEMWDTVKRIDIIYICSNADIARQNIKRLNVMPDVNVSASRRITLLPIDIHALRNNKVNFVALTPGTSLELKSSMGTQTERKLLYWLLKDVWSFKGASPKNLFQGGVIDPGRWRESLKRFPDKYNIDRRMAREFVKAVKKRCREQNSRSEDSLHERCKVLLTAYRRPGKKTRDVRHNRSSLIGELRVLLAEVCIEALEPDIVILDEFQRFKSLMDSDSDISFLADKLFAYSDEHTEVRTILLSATPYKMYALAEEDSEGDHYQDFIGTLRFLFDDQRKTDEFAKLLKDFRLELLRSGSARFDRLEELKSKIETRLRKVMVRTEKLASSVDRAGMLKEKIAEGMQLQSRDVLAYYELQQVTRQLDMPDTVEYWKSSSYLLNLMEDYKLKREFNDALDDPARNRDIARVLKGSENLLLHWEDIERYQQLDPRNARLRGLVEQTLEQEWWKLLWLSPSLPYYQLESPWADFQDQQPTKRLVFSSWRVVPKVIASVISYEAERRTSLLENPAAENSQEERDRRTATQLLRISIQENRETGMSVLGICFPCLTLARRYDPLVMTREFRQQRGRAPMLIDLQAKIEADLQVRLSKLSYPRENGTGRKDERWYWAAPLLMDRKNYPEESMRWFDQPQLAGHWSGEDGKAWPLHVERARQMFQGNEGLGPMPDDLPAVMTELALGGPATVAFRALSRVHPSDSYKSEAMRNAAARIGWAFRSLFNRFDAVSLLRGLKKHDPYWRGVLDYCASGNLQSVMDEYIHVLRDALGLSNTDLEDSVAGLAEAVCEALGIMPATLVVDDLTVQKGKVRKETHRMPTRFALAFGQGKEEDTGVSDASRSHKVREAFNSPFWPFVVASTSIGQEGLDFHLYCHAVMHWNLPSNPVDLEQREGRVHRFKGHAVRKNLAQKYGQDVLKKYTRDPLQELFRQGRNNRRKEDSDLVPFWIFPLEHGAFIERHVSALPLTRDRQLLESLRRSLVVYRMVFGQPRQEDLVEYLLKRFPEEERTELVDRLKIDLSP